VTGGHPLLWKMGLGGAGALAALGGGSVGARWLFYPGLALVLLALALPNYPGQPWREKWRNLVRHLPAARWLRRGEG
jgi:hypothetical protein